MQPNKKKRVNLCNWRHDRHAHVHSVCMRLLPCVQMNGCDNACIKQMKTNAYPLWIIVHSAHTHASTHGALHTHTHTHTNIPAHPRCPKAQQLLQQLQKPSPSRSEDWFFVSCMLLRGMHTWFYYTSKQSALSKMTCWYKMKTVACSCFVYGSIK